jgi:beta-N-acetylhexosaminidase
MNLVLPVSRVQAVSIPEELSAEQKARILLNQMSPEEKVGQLFLVTFHGTDTSEESQIYDLVKNKHIGGVVLLRENDNFSDSETNLLDAQTLINNLQAISWDPTLDDESNNSTYTPLFVSTNQDGDGFPTDQILKGLTPLADEMAIGATWETSSAETTGRILGQEFNVIGFNLLIGPSLDVTDSVRTVGSEDLGVRVFGGDPYWVAEMGKAYIRGVHEGSGNTVAVIAKNFPGRGSADRPAEDEVATVRKSLEQLKQIELAPFFAVTSQDVDAVEQADGLLVSHIRYQGFQGNIRATTRPISLDSTALGQILALTEFTGWRNDGGIMVSDDLGTMSIRNFFDPTGVAFDARQVAKSAFLAGNDLLYMGDLTSSGGEDNYKTISNCIDLFLQKYTEDAAFSQKVDDSVMRLLTLKYELYPEFSLSTVVRDPSLIESVGQNSAQTFQIAKASVTLISPDLGEMDTVLPDAPQINDRIVFISDLLTQKQCEDCAVTTAFSSENLRNAVIKLYGQNATGQIMDYRLSAYSFDDLRNMIDQTGDFSQLQDDLYSADWIVFSFLSDTETGIGQQVLRRFLSEKTSLIRDKKVIGFAFNAPYYLDATDISKLTAYYGIYGKSTPFVDVAARVLFQEIIPEGDLPVSVSGVGYDLISAMQPDPNQVIQLMVDESDSRTPESSTAEATPTPAIYYIGDTLAVKTGVIVDHNGNPVPDGTVVRFMIDTGSTSGSVETTETATVDGVARMNYRIPSAGLLGVTVQADPALFSQTLQLDITEKGGVLTAIEPTIMPTGLAATLQDDPDQNSETSAMRQAHRGGYTTPGDWLLSTIFILGLSALLFWIGSIRINLKWATRWGICSCLAGFVAFFYLAIGLPGSTELISTAGIIGITLVSILGVLLGWAAAGIWWYVRRPA